MFIQRLSSLPRGVQHSLVYALALALSKGLALVMVPVATHYLTPADYGRLDILQTLADLLSILIGMGLAETLFRFAGSETDSQRQREISASLFGMALLLGGSALLVTQLAAPLIAAVLPGDVSLLDLRLILASLALVGVILIPLAWLRLQDRPWLYLIGAAGRVVLQVCIAIPLLMMGLGITAVLLAGLISALLLCTWLIIHQVRETGIRFEPSQMRLYSRYAAPLILVGIAGFILGSFDRWILAEVAGPAALAHYALAAKFGLITAVLIQPFDLWWQARRFQLLKASDGEQACARAASNGIVLAMAAAICVTAAGPQLVYLLTPADYHGAVAFIPWLAALAAIHNITATLNFGAMSDKHTGRPAFIDVSAAGIALAGYFVLIPALQAQGAILATAIALTARLLATYSVSQQRLPLPFPVRRLLLMACLTLAVLLMMPSSTLSFSNLAIALVLISGFVLAALLLGLLPGLDRLTAKWRQA